MTEALSPAALYSLVKRHGACRALATIMVAAARVESGSDPRRMGDAGHSAGLWQEHDQGLGAGLSYEERFDPEAAAARMVPHFHEQYIRWQAAGFAGEPLAVRTYLWTERPWQYDLADMNGRPISRAAELFRAEWHGLTAPSLAPAQEAALQVLTAARELLGTPYGLPPGPGELDCSLFVLEACAAAGVPFPEGVRTAEQIRLACELVTSADDGWDNSQVRAGDLLFFERTYVGNSGERATHIGFALLDRRMLDANDAHGVGITVLSPWWTERLFEARRPHGYAEAAAPAPALATPSCEDLLAAERSWGSAMQVDVVMRSRQALERARQQRSWSDVENVIEWLRAHES